MGMTRNDTSSQGTFFAFIVGSVLGLAAGMLFAPQSGQESRERLRQKLQSTASTGKEKAGNVVDTAKVTVQEGSRAVKEARERVRSRTRTDQPGE